VGLFEADSITGYHGFIESQSRLRAIPVDELTNCMIVNRCELRELRLFRTADFDCSRYGSFRMVFGVRLRLFLAIPAVCRIEKVQA
jgi:hypothetical protein